MNAKRSLKDLLQNSNDDSDSEMDISDHDVDSGTVHSEHLCVECQDQPAELHCENCDENFCRVCFGYLHRTGKRSSHKTTELVATTDSKPEQRPEIEANEPAHTEEDLLTNTEKAKTTFKVNTKFIPMRLEYRERHYFRLLNAALEVSEYTDKVDILGAGSRMKRIKAQLKEICTVLIGLVVANNMEDGQKLLESKELENNAEWFKTIFEIGRRYKIMNPERMRGTFGKLMYMIMDSRLPEISETMGFDLYKPIKTVHCVLEQAGALELLEEDLIFTATKEISSDGKSRQEIQREIKQKEQAIERLARKYGQKSSSEVIRQVLYSIGDYHAYLHANRAPVQTMIAHLKSYFQAESFSGDTNLGISYGVGGARLSHNHKRQYQYVLQSLTLWSELMRDMYMLWKLSDDDMTSESRYTLADTGQGLNRIKACPKVSRAMYNILSSTQQKAGSWVGSSVVHLGDRAVPNALFFLDKYLQVPRILIPVNLVVTTLPAVARDPFVAAWIESQYGSVDDLQIVILADFFRHAFDGSGADNFYDAGSCIDGRLTSAWNWANTIAKKPYFKFFLVSGFTSFDGTTGF